MTSKELPDFVEFCLNVPLYHSFHIEPNNIKEIAKIHYDMSIRFDTYCIDCKKESTFASYLESFSKDEKGKYLQEQIDYEMMINLGIRQENIEKLSKDKLITQRFICQRNPKHTLLTFIFSINSGTITKIGQYPSMADIIIPEITHYRKILGEDRFQEFKKSIISVSHGYGICAFVYLRRIFEHLIEEAHKEAQQSETWNEDIFNKGRINDKIRLLKDLLPSFLYENRNIYSILSKGVHELNEQECLGVFHVLKTGVELILDEKLEKKKREEKIKSTKKEISKLHQDLKGQEKNNTT